MINVGDNNISGVYLGDEELSVYIGDELIYPLNFGTLTAITLDNLTWVTDIPYSGGTGTSANCSYIITGYYDSGKTRKLNRYAVVDGEITASSTTSETRDLIGTLVLTATCSGFSVTGSVDAYQEAYVVDYSKNYLTISVISGGTIEWIHGTGTTAMNILYSKDNGANWTTIASTTAGTPISVDAGDKVIFKGSNRAYNSADNYQRRHAFLITGCTANVEGNIMSMIAGDNFTGSTTITDFYTFAYFFWNCSGIISAENLIMPANAVHYCYLRMFQNCTSLTTAPVLPATSLTTTCYGMMFYDCSSLTYIKCLATSGINSSWSTNGWVGGVAATGTFVKKSGVTWPTGNSGIPSGWTVLEE